MDRLRSGVLWVVLPAALSAFASLVQAEGILVANSSFESPAVPAAGYLYANPDDWEGSDGASAGYAVNGVGGSTAFSNANGSQLALFYVADYGDGNGLHRSYLRQTLGTIQANTTYTAQLDIGRLSSVPGDSGSTFGFALGYGHTDGRDGNGTLARIDVPATAMRCSLLTTVTITTGAIAADSVAMGRDLTVWLLGSGATPNGESCCFVADNVRVVSSTIPEPTTITIVATGMIGLLAYAWRKRA